MACVVTIAQLLRRDAAYVHFMDLEAICKYEATINSIYEDSARSADSAGTGLPFVLLSVLEAWPAAQAATVAWPCVSTAWLCPDAVKLEALTLVRGCGLVASAYGMLHCRAEVERLVMHWRGGDVWPRRMQQLVDVVTWTQFRSPDSLAGKPPDRTDASAKEALARFGKWPPGAPAPGPLDKDTSAGARVHAERLRRLVPHQRGGGRAVLVLPGFVIPPSYWSAHKDVPKSSKGSEHSGGAHEQTDGEMPADRAVDASSLLVPL
jgi:hypothetical protein